MTDAQTKLRDAMFGSLNWKQPGVELVPSPPKRRGKFRRIMSLLRRIIISK